MLEDLREFRVADESTENLPLVSGVETVLWSTAAEKVGEWYRGGFLEAVERPIFKRHEDVAKLSR